MINTYVVIIFSTAKFVDIQVFSQDKCKDRQDRNNKAKGVVYMQNTQKNNHTPCTSKHQ